MTIPVIDQEKCTACEECVEACPVEAISMVNGKAKINPDECTECGTCLDVCPADAISES